MCQDKVPAHRRRFLKGLRIRLLKGYASSLPLSGVNVKSGLLLSLFLLIIRPQGV